MCGVDWVTWGRGWIYGGLRINQVFRSCSLHSMTVLAREIVRLGVSMGGAGAGLVSTSNRWRGVSVVGDIRLIMFFFIFILFVWNT